MAGVGQLIYQSLKANRLFYNLGVFWLFAMALLIAISPAPYLHDFAEWLFQGQILALKITDPQSVAGYTLAPYPVPNSLASALLALLCLFFEPILAGKIFLIALLLGWLWTIRIFVKRHVPKYAQGAVMLLLVSVVVFASFFWYGFVSYQLGLLLLIVFFSYKEKWSLSSMIGIGILLFLSHAMIFLIWCLFLGLVFLSGQGRLRQSVLLTFLYIAPLPIWFVLGRQLMGFVAPVADARIAGIMEFLLLKLASPSQHGGFRNMIQPDGSSLLEYHPWVYGLGAFSTLMVVIMLAIFILMAIFKTYLEKYISHKSGPGCNLMTFKGDGISPEGDFENQKSGKSFVVILRKLGIVLMALYCVAPFNFFGLIDPGGRLLLPLFILALLVADEASFEWLRRAAIPAAVAVSISVLSYAALVFQAANDKDFAYQGPPPSADSPPNHSVVAFNEWAYRNTRYRYFNFRVFAFVDRFRQLQSVSLSGLGFRTGQITSYNPVSSLLQDVTNIEEYPHKERWEIKQDGS